METRYGILADAANWVNLSDEGKKLALSSCSKLAADQKKHAAFCTTRGEESELWRELHLSARGVKNNRDRVTTELNLFLGKVRCDYCRITWQETMQEHLSSDLCEEKFFEWTILVHNEINKKTRKPQIDISGAEFLYGGTIKNFFDGVFFINLNRRIDRLSSFRNEIAGCNWPFVDPERFEAVDPLKIPPDCDWKSGGGAWGCLQSHKNILEFAIKKGLNSILVLEDDAVFVSGFAERVACFIKNVPDDWDQLMLGGQLMPDSASIEVNRFVKRVTNCQRTHAYAVRGQFIQDLCSKWKSSKTHCDHVMGPFQVGRNVYAPHNFLVGQGALRSDIGRGSEFISFVDEEGDSIYWLKDVPKETADRLRNIYFYSNPKTIDGVDERLAKIIKSVGNNRTHLIKKWIREIKIEGSCHKPPLPAMLWCPDINEEDIKKASTGDIIIIDSSQLTTKIQYPSWTSFPKKFTFFQTATGAPK